jgi:hypothetical protein
MQISPLPQADLSFVEHFIAVYGPKQPNHNCGLGRILSDRFRPEHFSKDCYGVDYAAPDCYLDIDDINYIVAGGYIKFCEDRLKARRESLRTRIR